MRAAVPFLSLFLLVAFSTRGAEGAPATAAGNPFPVRLSTRLPAQGEPIFVEVSPLPGADNVVMIWKGKEVPMKADGPGRFLGLVGIDLLETPGKAVLSFRAEAGGETLLYDETIRIRKKDFPVQKLSLPEEMTRFDKETLERIRREARHLEERFSRASSPPAWSVPFLPPVEDFRPKGFGSRRIINGEPRSPHAGVDVTLPAGTPVVAIADGVVTFAGEQFFGGNSVVMDHGGGVFSVYYHLQEYAVSEGQQVVRGERIGAVGASGRATGPHLHFSVRAAGGRIDPSFLFPPPPR